MQIANKMHAIKKSASEVSNFYNTIGWKEDDNNITEDASRWEDLRHHSKHYISKCRLRICKHIPPLGDKILDMTSGPIQYKEYLEYSKNYNKRYYVDFSSKALESAKRKTGDHGEFICGNFLDIDFEENFFDCSISLHTIYHIDKSQQEEAVRKLIKITKPGKPIIIIYSNPDTIFHKILKPLGILKRKVNDFFIKICQSFQDHSRSPKISLSNKQDENTGSLYFHPNRIPWWNRFSDEADIQIFPWRSLTADTLKLLVPNNWIGGLMLKCLWNLEETFQNFFSKNFYYPMIVLSKK